MDSLLGNYLSIGDLIVVHLCGKTKKLTLRKTQEYLGLTITDNAIGRAFVKKIKSNEQDGTNRLDENSIKPGDHISAINNQSTVGMRHYEVAKAIREVPQNTNFTMHLIEPLYSNDFSINNTNDLRDDDNSLTTTTTTANLKNGKLSLNLNNQCDDQTTMFSSKPPPFVAAAAVAVNQNRHDSRLDSPFDDLVDSSLPIDKLLSKGAYTQSEDQVLVNNKSEQRGNEIGHNSYRNKIEKINSILESFLGINDNALAIQIYRLAKENNESFNCFANAIKSSELNVFNFDECIEKYLWSCATGIKINSL